MAAPQVASRADDSLWTRLRGWLARGNKKTIASSDHLEEGAASAGRYEEDAERYRVRSDLRPNDIVNDALRDIFRAHGLAAAIEHGWLTLPGSPIKVNGALFVHSHDNTPVSLQLDVRIQVETGSRIIVESFAGLGDTEEAALANAYQGFCQGTLHVLLAAFLGWDGEEVTTETWQVGSLTKVATIGDFVIKANPSFVRRAGAQVVPRFGHLQNAIQAAEMGPGIHWVRLYYAQMGGKTLTSEVLLDNDTWEPIQAQVEQWGWIKSDELYSMRVFLILQDPPDLGHVANHRHEAGDTIT
jgi:hypothetical protein